MSISIGSSYLDAYNSRATNAIDQNRATGASSSIGGISQNSTKEELTEAVKSFEQYFVESILKQFKESFSSIGGSDSNSTASQYTDYYMDFAISDVAKQLVDEYGKNLTEDFVAQIQRNYGITDTEAASDE